MRRINSATETETNFSTTGEMLSVEKKTWIDLSSFLSRERNLVITRSVYPYGYGFLITVRHSVELTYIIIFENLTPN